MGKPVEGRWACCVLRTHILSGSKVQGSPSPLTRNFQKLESLCVTLYTNSVLLDHNIFSKFGWKSTHTYSFKSQYETVARLICNNPIREDGWYQPSRGRVTHDNKLPFDDKICEEKEWNTVKTLELMSFNFKPGELASLLFTHEEIETPNPGVRIRRGKNLNNVKLTFRGTEGNYFMYPFETWVYWRYKVLSTKMLHLLG